MTTGPLVAVRDVFVAFRGAAGGSMALRGIDLEIALGERVVIQGPNGSGKSTLLRVITGEQPVLAGGVDVAGASLHRLGAAERRRWRGETVGFVDEHVGRSLLPELTVAENVAVSLRLQGERAPSARRTGQLTLERLGLGGLAGRPVADLSGGEARRVSICAAVVHRPRLVLADEPTGELDDTSASQVFDLLDTVATGGTSLILVSHDTRAVRFADRVVRLRRGQVVAPVAPRPETSGVSADWSVPVGLPSAGGVLAELVNVAAAYGSRAVLAGVNLVVSAGSVTAVTGPSGSGKSTLLQLLAGVLDAQDGAVRIAGVVWTGRSRSDRATMRRDAVAFAPQQPALVEALTVRENLELVAGVRGQVPTTSDQDRVAAVLGLEPLLEEDVSRLSAGERQRVGLGRCLVTRAPLLVIDEPTSQQDERSAARVVHALRAEASAGRGVIVATHDEALVRAPSAVVTLGHPMP